MHISNYSDSPTSLKRRSLKDGGEKENLGGFGQNLVARLATHRHKRCIHLPKSTRVNMHCIGCSVVCLVVVAPLS